MASSDSNGSNANPSFKEWYEANVVGDNFGGHKDDIVSFSDSLQGDFNHGVHAMIWAYTPEDKLVLGKYNPKAAILMHLRFDGHIGFAGGKIDEDVNGLDPLDAGEKVTVGLIRELQEEINADPTRIKINWAENYRYSYRLSERRYYLHFFSINIPYEYFLELEAASLKSKEHGDEVMGNFRVPLYTLHDDYRGLPAFLNNMFIGAAKEQLLMGCRYHGLLSSFEMQEALLRAKVGKTEKSTQKLPTN